MSVKQLVGVRLRRGREASCWKLQTVPQQLAEGTLGGVSRSHANLTEAAVTVEHSSSFGELPNRRILPGVLGTNKRCYTLNVTPSCTNLPGRALPPVCVYAGPPCSMQ